MRAVPERRVTFRAYVEDENYCRFRNSLGLMTAETGHGSADTGFTFDGALGGKPSAVANADMRIVHLPNWMTDQEVICKVRVVSSFGGSNVAAIIKRTSSNNLLLVLVDGTNLQLYSVLTGAFTQLGTNAAAALSADTWYWLRATVVGNDLTGEVWTTDPDLGGSPLATRTVTLAGATATAFGSGVYGSGGARFAPGASSRQYYINSFRQRVAAPTYVSYSAPVRIDWRPSPDGGTLTGN